MEGLLPWCFISADCAYGLTQRLMIPFNAAELLGDDHRTLTFIYLSCEFGLRWRLVSSQRNGESFGQH